MGTVENSSAQCSVTANTSAGFIAYIGAGYPKGTIRNCYARGSATTCEAIQGTMPCIGGLVGYIDGYESIENFYAAVTLNDPVGTIDIGGLVGYDGTTWTPTPLVLTNCYYDKEVAGSESGLGHGMTTAQMKSAGFVVSTPAEGAGLPNTAYTAVAGAYPHLFWQSEPGALTVSCNPVSASFNNSDQQPEFVFTKDGETIILTPGVDYTYAWNVTPHNAGTYKAMITMLNEHYQVANAAVFEITKIDATISAQTPYEIEYGHEFNPMPHNVHLRYIGEVTVTDSAADYTPYDPVGVYKVLPTYDPQIDVNFNITSWAGTLTVYPNDYYYTTVLTNKQINVGDPLPPLAASFKIDVGVDIYETLIVNPVCDYKQGDGVGDYQIHADATNVVWGDVDSRNYEISFKPATLHVVQAYTLTVIDGTPDSARLAAGETIVLTANERAGAIFTKWTIGNEVVSEAISFTYTMPNTDVEIIANFEPFTPPPLDPVYGLTATQTVEYIQLTWKNDGESKSFDVYRNDVKIGSVKAGSAETLEFTDYATNLEYGESYEYRVVSKSTTRPSEPIVAELTERPFETHPFGTAHVITIPADSVAAADGAVAYEKPSFAAYYVDPAKDKTKKVALVLDKNTLSPDNARVYSKTEIALFDSKKYNKRTIPSHEYIKDPRYSEGQCPAMELEVRVKKADKTHKSELRTFVEIIFLPPEIQTITADSYLTFDNISGIKVNLNTDADFDAIVSGKHFGIKTPKVWVEYIDQASKKVKKQTLKVKPLEHYKKTKRSELTKSSITDEYGTSDCIITIPAKKWAADKAKKGSVPEYNSFVISTGKAIDAVPFEIIE